MTKLELRWVDEHSYAHIEDAFRRRDLAAIAELCSRSLERLPSVIAPGLGPRDQAEWHQGARAVFENFLARTEARRSDMLGEWSDSFLEHVALCIALPSFLPMYALEKKVGDQYASLNELCRTGADWRRALDAAESALGGKSADRSEFRIVWANEPSLAILGSFDGGLWKSAAERAVGAALLANAKPVERLLGAQAKVLNAAERLEVESFAAAQRSRPGVQGQVATALHALVTAVRYRGYGVLSLAY